MLAKEIRDLIITPVLALAGWTDKSSNILIYGTGYVETAYSAIIQTGAPKDGGFGFFQMQPDDYADIIKWLGNEFNKFIVTNILDVCHYHDFPNDIDSLMHNIAYSILMCRIHYCRIKEPLPNPKDARGFAIYHKRYYNGGLLGKADVDKNTGIFERIINDEL